MQTLPISCLTTLKTKGKSPGLTSTAWQGGIKKIFHIGETNYWGVYITALKNHKNHTLCEWKVLKAEGQILYLVNSKQNDDLSKG